MMKRNRKGTGKQILAAAAVAALLTACGSSGKGVYNLEGAYETSAESAAYDTAAADAGGVMSAGSGFTEEAAEYTYAEAAAEEPVYEEGASEIAVPEAAATTRKLIKTVYLSAETEAFDTLVPGLQKRVEELGGYIESISVYDVDTYYVGDSLQKRRCADITARVPKEKLDGFLEQVGEQTNVTSRSESVEDVTLQYVDLESHKKVLLTEQKRLLALLEQAQSVEDIIAIEGRLSEVRYQLESMESQLRTYDNKIDYSTAHLSLEEVRKYSPAQTATVWQRIENGFMKSLEDIGYGIRDCAIGFVIDLPYIILGLLGIVVVFFVLRILLKRFWRGRFMQETARKCGKLLPVRRGADRDGQTAETEKSSTIKTDIEEENTTKTGAEKKQE